MRTIFYFRSNEKIARLMHLEFEQRPRHLHVPFISFDYSQRNGKWLFGYHYTRPEIGMELSPAAILRLKGKEFDPPHGHWIYAETAKLDADPEPKMVPLGGTVLL